MNTGKGVFLLVSLLGVSLMCGGCETIEDFRHAKEAGKKVEYLNLQLDSATKRVEFLEKENTEIKEKIDKQFKYLLEEISSLKEIVPARASLNPSSNKFAIVSVAGGFFSVACDNIVGYASGSKVYLSVTNFMSVDMTGVNVEVEYSPSLLDDKGNLKENFMSYFKKTKEKINTIKAGSAKIVEIRVPEYKPDEVANLSVSIYFEGIRFIGDKQPQK